MKPGYDAVGMVVVADAIVGVVAVAVVVVDGVTVVKVVVFVEVVVLENVVGTIVVAVDIETGEMRNVGLVASVAVVVGDIVAKFDVGHDEVEIVVVFEHVVAEIGGDYDILVAVVVD